jgi:hypothetical protein
MNNKIKAFAILPLAAALTFFGLQAMTSSFAATGAGSDPTSATTGADADTIEDCGWYLNGVETALVLSNESGMEYIGDNYTLTTEDDNINVYFSGTESEDVRCSFYDDVQGARVEVTWDGVSFTAGADTSLDWDLGDSLEGGDTSSLDIEYATGTSCDAAFTSGSSASITSGAISPQVPASISNSATGGFAPTDLSAPTFAKCNLDASYSVVLPGGRTPASPGSSYTFTGPGLTTTITVGEAPVGD